MKYFVVELLCYNSGSTTIRKELVMSKETHNSYIIPDNFTRRVEYLMECLKQEIF